MTIADNNDNIGGANSNGDDISVTNSDILNPIQIPIVGYEIMEERARFTVSITYFMFLLL